LINKDIIYTLFIQVIIYIKDTSFVLSFKRDYFLYQSFFNSLYKFKNPFP